MFTISELFRKTPNEFAAIDLGSNSFHMVVARQEDGELRILDRLKESVRLGFGLTPEGDLDDAAKERALACLRRFGERLSHLPSGSVRCVGTKTLRSANNTEAFLSAAEDALGHPIEIISGAEEARLIYDGVAHSLAGQAGNRLVVDIGGGSTEIIIGKQFSIDFKDSLGMGCVAITRQFFPDGKVTGKAIQAALMSCWQEIEPILRTLKRFQWEHEVGASGTIKAAFKVCQANGWGTHGITLEGLEKICTHYEAHGNVEGLSLPGLSADREPVFLGGVIVLRALFESLQLKSMEASQGALREGLLYDLVGRYGNQDIRETSVRQLAQRFHVDTEQAERVANTALELMQQVQQEWDLNPEEAGRYLRWSAYLLEVGLDIAHANFHKHSAYICEHSDMAGFSQQEQQILAFLVLSQRKKFPAKTYKEQKDKETVDKAIQRLSVLLRLAVILHRARADHSDIRITLSAQKKKLALHLAPPWFAEQPLLQADLASEAQHLAAIGYELSLDAPSPST
ncbi:exopolyphosphatase [Salinispirillum marinum]|uniref:Exopolyphosphatase n=2 Tax=Saccharospirillaceae TaxID=255527 RepID=A0ABV8BC00_9GAMM